MKSNQCRSLPPSTSGWVASEVANPCLYPAPMRRHEHLEHPIAIGRSSAPTGHLHSRTTRYDRPPGDLSSPSTDRLIQTDAHHQVAAQAVTQLSERGAAVTADPRPSRRALRSPTRSISTPSTGFPARSPPPSVLNAASGLGEHLDGLVSSPSRGGRRWSRSATECSWSPKRLAASPAAVWSPPSRTG